MLNWDDESVVINQRHSHECCRFLDNLLKCRSYTKCVLFQVSLSRIRYYMQEQLYTLEQKQLHHIQQALYPFHDPFSLLSQLNISLFQAVHFFSIFIFVSSTQNQQGIERKILNQDT